MLYYLNIFLIYSFFGFIMETSLKTFVFKEMNNGILYGPWIPVYGFGVMIIVFIMRFVFNRFRVNRVLKVIFVFILSMITLTILEYLGGNLIEILFDKVFWDYSYLKFNSGHYIALEISLLWGVMSLFVIYVIKPIVDKIIKKIPSSVTYLLFGFFIIDVIFTFVLKY